METSRECHVADQCERQAATVKNPRARQLLLEVAAQWRQMGDDLKADVAFTRQSRPPASQADLVDLPCIR